MKLYNNYFGYLLPVFIISCLLALSTIINNASATPIIIDGNLNDWSDLDRLDLPPGSVSDGYDIYGRFENDQFLLAFRAETGDISTGSTIWLNTDQDTSTGYQIFADPVTGIGVGGMEFNVNIHTDNKPYLYSGAAAETFISPLTHVHGIDSSGRKILEISIPNSQINVVASSVDLFFDINDNTFIPTFYTNNNLYNLNKQGLPIANTTDTRVAIIYSQSTANNFFGQKAYNQLFMSAQMQSVMAGVPFDLLNEDDLIDLNKIIQYDALIFPYFANAQESLLPQITENLSHAVHRYKIGLISAGNFLTNTETGASLSGDAYLTMKNLMGITRVDGAGPVDITVNASINSHPVLMDYNDGEQMFNYNGAYIDYFAASAPTEPVTTLATQSILGGSIENAILASEKGGARSVHFSTVQLLGDGNMLYPAIQWAVHNTDSTIGLKLSRQDSVFISRNDMDQSMFADEINSVEVPLLALLQTWKANYNFVGSYYINVGNNPTAGEFTDWTISAPLYQQYLALDNEIGTHSYTHPSDTNILTPTQIQFEFADSIAEIETQLGLTNLGAAVPGAPENFNTATEVIQHTSYLSGGYAGIGAGFPNAIGYLTPDSTKVYLSPNMTFDFTNMDFLKLTAAQTKAKWLSEFDQLSTKAEQPIIHWPWHDYGVTTSLTKPLLDANGNPELDENGNPIFVPHYTIDMFESLLSKAFNAGSEFVTADDFRKRLESFKAATLTLTRNGDNITAEVTGSNLGRSAIKVDDNKMIKSVDNWYAYNDQYLYLDQDAGSYNIHLGNSQDAVTHISYLPMRANLTSITGDGQNLSFSFTGEGTVEVELACTEMPMVTGADQYNMTGTLLKMEFNAKIAHNAVVQLSCP